MSKELEAAVNEYMENGFPLDRTATGHFRAGALYWEKHSPKVLALIKALEKIADPRLRDHREPDKYTEVGCMIYMAEQALAEFKKAE